MREAQSLRSQLDGLRAAGRRIALVPTMGNLHDGHLSLLDAAAERADFLVASIYVNPLQFGLGEDWEQYPRTLDGDCERLERAGCDLLFHPDDRGMYPGGTDCQTRVFCPDLSDILCGASRPGHFQGVATVVAKLLHLVEPTLAVFGRKDYQQLLIIRRMVQDLCMRVRIVSAPVVREADGLAMSSRNRFLDADERPRAACLHTELGRVASGLRAGRRDWRRMEREAMDAIEARGLRPDYISIRCARTLAEVPDADDAPLVVLGALYARGARIIDNVQVPDPGPVALEEL